jgi:hypothetical protein
MLSSMIPPMPSNAPSQQPPKKSRQRARRHLVSASISRELHGALCSEAEFLGLCLPDYIRGIFQCYPAVGSMRPGATSDRLVRDGVLAMAYACGATPRTLVESPCPSCRWRSNINPDTVYWPTQQHRAGMRPRRMPLARTTVTTCALERLRRWSTQKGQSLQATLRSLIIDRRVISVIRYEQLLDTGSARVAIAACRSATRTLQPHSGLCQTCKDHLRSHVSTILNTVPPCRERHFLEEAARGFICM